MVTKTITQEDWYTLSSFVLRYDEIEGTMDSIMLSIASNSAPMCADEISPYFIVSSIKDISQKYFNGNYSDFSTFIQEHWRVQRDITLSVQVTSHGDYDYTLGDEEDPDEIELDSVSAEEIEVYNEEFYIEDRGEVRNNYFLRNYESYLDSVSGESKEDAEMSSDEVEEETENSKPSLHVVTDNE